MIRTGLLSTKPAIATAVPVNELSSEMTTGMSAPPMAASSSRRTRARRASTSPRTGTLSLPIHR